ncbi:MAG: hypothetical protein K6F53_06735 [Lachnospiraceae bacterium]|nr:hypothetical protein [Lachnospiraceae bacterium]
MKYYRYLYTGGSVKNVDKYKLRLKIHKDLVGFFVLTLAEGPNQIDILNAFNLKLPYYRKHPPVVVGIAKNYEEAVEIVIRMTTEALEHTGSADIRNYLKLRAKTKDFTTE